MKPLIAILIVGLFVWLDWRMCRALWQFYHPEDRK
jgi:hypothetical protein